VPAAPPTKTECLALVAISLCALALQLVCAFTWPLSFDESWHVFFAELRPLRKVVAEIRSEGHPPLVYLLLRPFADLGSEPGWPRLLSVLAALPQPYLVFRIARRVGVSGGVALFAAGIFALSHSFTTMSVVVRAYGIAELFLLLGMIAWLDLLFGGPGADRRTFLAFAFASTLAAWCEYPAALVTGALLAATLAWAAFSTPFRAAMRSRLRRASSTSGLLVLFGGHGALVAYYVVWHRGGALGHLGPWLRTPAESFLEYFVRGSVSNLAYFTPFVPGDDLTGGLVVGMLAAALAWTGVASRSAAPGPAAPVVLLELALLWLSLYLLGTLGAYPFGGWARQQYFVFPLMVLAFSLALHAVDDRLPGAFRWAVRLIVALVAAATTWSSFQGDPYGERVYEPIWVEPGKVLFDVSDDAPLYMPKYGFIGLYGSHRGLDWRWERTLDDHLDVFRIGPGDGRTVYRDRRAWEAPLVPDRELLDHVRELREREGVERLLVFSPGSRPTPDALPEWRRPAVGAFWRSHGWEMVAWRVFPKAEVYAIVPWNDVPGAGDADAAFH
jgi:hypothetical protein